KVVPRKRVHVAARAAYDAGAEFHVIGTAPDRDYLRTVRQANPDATVHEGLADEAVAELLGGADIFVHASEAEALSLAVLEAMASGLPLVYSPACDGVADTVGLRVAKDDDPAAYRDAIATLMRDDEQRRLLGRRARHRAES